MKLSGRQYKAVWLLVLALLLITPIAAPAGFVQTKEGTRYTTKAGKIVIGLRTIRKKVYLFGEDGIMLKGVQRVGSKYYFFDLKTGARRYGWIRSAGKRYYANKRTGVLFRSRKKGTKYYFGPDCALVTKPSDSAGLSGWVQIGKKKYYFGPDHKRVTGLYQIGKKVYAFGRKGVLLKNRIVTQDGKSYYAGPKGSLYKNVFVTVKGKKYYATEDGSFAVGMRKIGNATYYFREDGQLSGKTKITIDGSYYIIRKSGKVATNCWIKYEKKYYRCGPDGKVLTNQYIGTKYFVGADGVRIKASKPSPGVATAGERTVVYGNDGLQLVSQWYSTSDGKRYYLGGDGGALTGLQIIGGYKYYFGSDGTLQTDRVIYANGYCYYTSSADGHIVSESSQSGAGIVSYARQFVGNPYVYGGTSLTHGADCSGFTQAVLAHFGIRILRVAVDQMNGASGYNLMLGYASGTRVSDANLQPGDLVFYGSASYARSYASHVAIYAGNGQIVHAANSRVGIVTSPIDYMGGRLHNMNRRYWAR